MPSGSQKATKLTEHTIRELRRVCKAAPEESRDAQIVLLLDAWQHRRPRINKDDQWPELMYPKKIAEKFGLETHNVLRLIRGFRKRLQHMSVTDALAYTPSSRKKSSRAATFAPILQSWLSENPFVPGVTRLAWTLASLARQRVEWPDGTTGWLLPRKAGRRGLVSNKELHTRIEMIRRALLKLDWQLDGQHAIRPYEVGESFEDRAFQDTSERFGVVRTSPPSGATRGKRRSSPLIPSEQESKLPSE